MDANDRRKLIMEHALREKEILKPENAYKPRDGDLIAVGPSKSGTTWLQQILHQIRSKGDEDFNEINEVTWFIYHPKKQPFDFNFNAEQPFNPRVFKIHEPYGVFPTTEKQKHIVIVRDPYDSAYSLSKFLNGFFGGDEEISEDDLNETMIKMNEDNVSGNFKCISSWFEHRNDPNVLFLFYEDFKKDLAKSIKIISKFVEIPLTDDELRRVLHFCSFEYMSREKGKFQVDSNFVDKLSTGLGIEKWQPTVSMVRTDGGKVGQGKSKIGPKLKATVDRLWKENVEEKFGIKSYKDMYDQYSILA